MGTIFNELDHIKATKALKKHIDKHNKWEKKMEAKGWSYIRVAEEIVPTWVFVSPERRKEIEAQNDAFYKRHQIKRTK